MNSHDLLSYLASSAAWFITGLAAGHFYRDVFTKSHRSHPAPARIHSKEKR